MAGAASPAMAALLSHDSVSASGLKDLERRTLAVRSL
jgi:hypothetical protein